MAITDASFPRPGDGAVPPRDVLLELSVAAASSESATGVLLAALDVVGSAMAIDRAAVLMLEIDGSVRCVASRGLSDEQLASCDSTSAWPRYLKGAAPLVVTDVSEATAGEELLASAQAFRDVRALTMVPVAIGPRIFGQLALFFDRPRALADDELLVLRALAANIALALNRTDDRLRARVYRELLEKLGVALYTTDAEGRITFFNEEAAALWGRTPELESDRWCGSLRLFHPDGTPMPHDESQMAITLREGRAVHGREAVAERPDGTRVTFAPYPSPILDRAGKVLGGVNVLIDVTRRRHAEAALISALREKEEANAALQQVAIDLSIANAAKDEFLSLVSHELKTPLTTIRGNATILARTNNALDTESVRAALKDIVAESERLNRIIENLLLIARAEGGHTFEVEPVLVTRVVERVIARHQLHNPERVVEVRQRGDSRPVVFSEAFMEQVIDNLMSNAEKYSPVSEPIIIEVERKSREVRVRVLDRGAGVRSEDLSRLFDSFYRSGSAKGKEGLGIGLAVCKRLVEAQGGRIWASPRPGGGSEFGFALPVADEADESASGDG
jgi:PAS domain S-box-containing protein